MEKSTGSVQEKIDDQEQKPLAGPSEGHSSLYPKKSFKRKKGLIILVLLLALPVAVYYGYNWVVFHLDYVITDDAQIKSDLHIISSKVGGRVEDIFIDEGDSLEEGQRLLVLDAREYLEEQMKAKASLQNLESELERAKINLQLVQRKVSQEIAEAETYLNQSKESLEMAREDTRLREEKAKKEVERAEAGYQVAKARAEEIKNELEKARREVEKARALFKERIMSETERDNRETDLKTWQARLEMVTRAEMEAKAAVEQARSDLRTVTLKKQQEKVVEASQKVASIQLDMAEDEKVQITIQELNIKALQAKVEEAEANFNLASLKLGETLVKSPERGVVARRLIRFGEIIQTGQPLFVINNPKKVWIVANLEETKVGKIKSGNSVLITVDAYPKTPFEGRVGFIGSATTSELALFSLSNSSRNFIKVIHRIPIRITLDESNGLLRPGMNVNVAIRIEK